ncbi:unnamed protein product, partial [Sphenostylis stenocarpa]
LTQGVTWSMMASPRNTEPLIESHYVDNTCTMDNCNACNEILAAISLVSSYFATSEPEIDAPVAQTQVQ